MSVLLDNNSKCQWRYIRRKAKAEGAVRERKVLGTKFVGRDRRRFTPENDRPNLHLPHGTPHAAIHTHARPIGKPSISPDDSIFSMPRHFLRGVDIGYNMYSTAKTRMSHSQVLGAAFSTNKILCKGRWLGLIPFHAASRRGRATTRGMKCVATHPVTRQVLETKPHSLTTSPEA